MLASTLNNPASGTLTAVLSNADQLTTDDYRIVVTGTGPNAYQLTNLATGATTSGLNNASLLTAIPGLSITPPATLSAGDTFTIYPTRNAARDITLASTLNTTTIAAAAPVAVNAATTNTGAAKVTTSGVTSTPFPAAGTLPITLTYNSATGQFSYGAPATTVAYTSGTPMTIAGNITVTLSGQPANGDQFTIGPNTNGVSDSRNALLLAKLQTANTMIGGTTSYQGGYSQLVSMVGNKSAEVQVTAKAEENLLAQAKSSQQALSGVNLDEEAADLMRYQQAYQAAGKMMQISAKMFDTLLQIGG